MLVLDLEEVKSWLRTDTDDDDRVIETLIKAAVSYVYTATGRKTFGDKMHIARLVCLYMVSHWYENRDFYNPTPNSIRNPVLTAMITQLQFGGYGDELD